MSVSKVAPLFAVAFFASTVTASPVREDWSSSRGAYDVHAIAFDRFVIESRRQGEQGKIARFTVKPGDVFNNSSGERSEVVLGGPYETSQFRVAGDEGVEYYRVSVKLDQGWRSPEYNARGQRWGAFLQLHGPNEYISPPAVALHAENEFGLFVLGGDLAAKSGGRRVLKNSALNPGRWVDFILAVKWAVDASGSIAVFRRDEGIGSWEKVADIKSVATLQYRGVPALKPHYWKAGFYRSQTAFTNTLWLGPIIRAKTFAEAAK